MRDTDTKWRDIICPSCDSVLVRFYKRDGRVMLDYCTTYVSVDTDARIATPGDHHEWFNGIDYLDEIADCSSVLLDVECRCQSRGLDLADVYEIARASAKPRAPWRER